MNFTDTIAAVATGGSISAIGIVRISGESALTAADSIFRAKNGLSLLKAQDRQFYYGELMGSSGELIDLCLCVVSRAPRSYTGEDTVEFHCHGSPVVLSEVLKALFELGVRQARPGEFTKRAFLNGKVDLTQAEAVIDLIESETPLGAKNSAKQLQGALYLKLDDIYNRLVDIMAHFHAVIDYPDEDIDDFDIDKYESVLCDCEMQLSKMLSTHERSSLLRGGIPTAIIGRTNTGKSSLLNALLGYERAIVTDIHGTTRDTVEEKVLIGDVLLRLIDTAGLRKTDDAVEKLGLERTLAAIAGANLILAVLDGSQPLQDNDYEVLKAIPPDIPVIIAVNKSDLSCNGCRRDAAVPDKAQFPSDAVIAGLTRNPPPPTVRISAKTGYGLDTLESEIQKLFPAASDAPVGEIITGARQAEALTVVVSCIHATRESLAAKISPDAVLTDIEAALSAIGEITGKTIREDIVSRIFERFCVGK